MKILAKIDEAKDIASKEYIDNLMQSLDSTYQPLISNSNKLAYSLISGVPTSLPASDVYAWAKASTKPSYAWTEITSKPSFATVATSGSYNDLSNKPTIPTNTNQLTNGAGFITSSALSSYLPLSGGELNSSNLPLYINRESGTVSSIGYKVQGVTMGILGFDQLGNLTTRPNFQTNTNYYIVWHEGNLTPSNYLLASAYTASDVLTKLKTVDGSGSGLDADLLDGVQLSGLLTNVSSSGDTNLSITVGGVTKSIALLYSKGAMSFYTPWNNPTSGSYDLNSHLLGMARHYGGGGTLLNAPSSFGYGSILCLSTGIAALSGQLAWNINHASTTDTTKALYWRAADNPNGYTYAKWHQIAFTDSNVASATKLQTARTIWGQSFDGSGDITGMLNITGGSESGMVQNGGRLNLGPMTGTHLMLDSNDIQAKTNGTTAGTLYLNDWGGNVIIARNSNVGIGTTTPLTKLDVYGSITLSNANDGGGECSINFARAHGYINFNSSGSINFSKGTTSGEATIMRISSSGYVGINTYQPAHALHVVGDILATGGITSYSDIRKKEKLQDVQLTLKQIADAPLIEHYYKHDDKKTTHVGSIAQYWAGMNDWFCKLDSEGYYTMEIQNAALASAISIARELVKYESKTDRTIRLLKKRINQLEDEIENLKKGA